MNGLRFDIVVLASMLILLVLLAASATAEDIANGTPVKYSASAGTCAVDLDLAPNSPNTPPSTCGFRIQASTDTQNEPPRVLRRLVQLSPTSLVGLSSLA
jgi:hypothetical protein